ncbi:hypothetical protein DFJ43DRAFT_1169110 [Lentinula guzmanii]|uniref:Uncharacterized protein n=1 Tax=Lentinula guzmanii TaxID=2804957 RepID=A0AA38MUX4_9AGAR|nr:hypothetical protein DFJ43DRAFT_1169110 [Lentinula guzmanii]
MSPPSPDTTSPYSSNDPTSLPTATGLTPELEQGILSLIQKALAQQQSGSSPPPPAPTPTNGLPRFVGPLSSSAAAGASSLLCLFPEVEAATITSIINHEFRASDLYKLDSRYRDKTERQVLSLKGETLELTRDAKAMAVHLNCHKGISHGNLVDRI